MKTFNKIFKIIAVLIVGCFWVLAISNMFSEGRVNLDKADKITGQITHAYQATSRTGGKYASDALVFAFKLNNYNYVLGVYRPSRNYKKLIDNLKPGDFVAVTYKHYPQDKINLRVYEIKKGRQVVLEYESYKRNHILASILCSIIAVVAIIFAIYKILKT